MKSNTVLLCCFLLFTTHEFLFSLSGRLVRPTTLHKTDLKPAMHGTARETSRERGVKNPHARTYVRDEVSHQIFGILCFRR